MLCNGLLHYQTEQVNIICLLMHSLVSSTIVISVILTFNIALVFLNLYAATVYCEI